MKFNIEKKVVGESCPALIVAELSCNHLQKYSLAVRTIKAMAKAGGDAVKLQTYKPKSLTLDVTNQYFKKNKKGIWKGMTPWDIYEKAYTPWKWQPKLKNLAESLGMICFSSPFDHEAVEFYKKMKMPAYKVASLEITDIPLIEHMAKQGKPMIMSTGVATIKDLKLAVKTCHDVGNKKIALLKCVSAYPTSLGEVNLRSIVDLKERFKTLVGLSDHTLSSSVAVGAVALGASIVEKHFILSRKLPSLDKEFSLEPNEFEKMIKEIREIEKALGEKKYILTKNQEELRKKRRSLFVVKDIKKGEKLTRKNVRSLRPGFGLHPKYLKDIIGKKAKRAIRKGTPLNWRLIKNGG